MTLFIALFYCLMFYVVRNNVDLNTTVSVGDFLDIYLLLI